MEYYTHYDTIVQSPFVKYVHYALGERACVLKRGLFN